MTERYASPAAVEAAIKEAARRAFASDHSLTVQERIRQEYFHRFLSRVFSEETDSNWMLKGGAGMLARVASARTTTDIDLFRRTHSPETALADLRRLAAIDLGDFFRFEYVGYTSVIEGNQETYSEGYQVKFDVYIGVKKKDSFHVDLVINVVVTDDVEVMSPANALFLPKLPSHPYRLYPVVDQIADKVCATLTLYNGSPSSREKDLVDLVVLAVIQDVEARKLSEALAIESRVRGLARPSVFIIPERWGVRYKKLAAKIPACEGYRSVDEAKNLMQLFIDPVLDGRANDRKWNHTLLSWE
ncbi:MAG: nucleotidyl transferase AbiEii/AbiGii toxin family protein [Ancrocorticia sp.]